MIFSFGFKKIVIIFGAFLFLGIIFLFLSPQKAQAAVSGHGWTRPQGSVAGCGGGLSAVKAVIADPVDLQAEITIRVRNIAAPHSVVTAVSGTGGTAYTGCVFDPSNHYIEVQVLSTSGYRPHSTKFTMNNPSNWTNKLITFESFISPTSPSQISAAAWWETFGEWFNYNPSFMAASFHVWSPGTAVSRVTLDLNGPVSLDKEFNGSFIGFINLGVQPELSPSPDPTVADGWYNWGVFMNDNSSFFAVSAWSGFGSFGIDRQVPTVSCSINPSSPPNAPYTTTSVDVTVSSSDSGGSGLAEGELQLSINGGAFTTISDILNGTYDHAVGGVNNTYEYRYRARDNTVNASNSTEDSWSPYTDCGTVTIDDYPSPDLIIYYQEGAYDTYNQSQILSSFKPPSTPGDREFTNDTEIFLHGSVKNLGKSILAGTQVKVRVQYNVNPPLNNEGTFEFTLTPTGDWEAGEVVPFGTACGDVNGDGIVNADDVTAVIANISTQDINYDLDDDGDVDGTTGGDVDIATNQIGTTCTRDIKFTTPLVLIDPVNGDNYIIVAEVDPDDDIPEGMMPGGEINNTAFESYTVVEGGTMSISLPSPSIFMLQNDQKATQVTFNWGGNWDNNATVVLEATGPNGPLPVLMEARFNDSATPLNPYIGTKGDTSQVSLDFINTGVAIGDYPISITATATQSSPYTQRVSTFALQIRVREAHPWFKFSIGGDVGSTGKIETKIPNTAISNFTFLADTSGFDSSHRICHNRTQLINGSPQPHAGVFYSNTAYEVGHVDSLNIICRAYLSFDTSSVPAGANITSAKLIFKYENEWTSTNFDIDLVEKDWPSAPGWDSNPILLDNNWHLVGDSEQTIFNTISLDPTSGTRETLSVNLSDLSVINAGGISKFEIKAKNELTLPDGTNLLFKMWPPMKLQITLDNAPAPDTNFLVIADQTIIGFDSLSDWVVSGYSNSGNIDHGFETDPYDQLWEQFGKKAIAHSCSGAIPGGVDESDVYVCDGDYDYTGTGISAPGEIVFFINGDLNINSKINLVGGKKVVFIVKGDVNVDPDVKSIDGFFVVEGQFKSGNNFVPAPKLGDNVGFNSSIAILPPPFEQEVISYYDATNKTLKVGSCQGNVNGCNRREFSPSVVSTIDDAGDVGQYSSIAIGDDGFPVISYYDEGNGFLKVAKCFSEYCTGGNEKINFADTSVGVGQFTSIALGANGNPVIAYYDFANGNLKVSICGDTDCNSSTERTLESGGDVGKYASIAVCTAAGCLDNNPVIYYFDSTLTRAMVYKCSNVNCSSGFSSQLDNSGSVGWGGSLALGADHFPVISYYDLSNTNLMVAKCDSPNCSSSSLSTVTSDDDTEGFGSSIAVGTDGKPVISYAGIVPSSGDIALYVVECNDAACAGGDETPILIDNPSRWTGGSNSIAIGPSNLPVISYQEFFALDFSTGQLKVAKDGDIDGTPRIQGCTSLVLWDCAVVDGLSTSGDCPNCGLKVTGGVIAFGNGTDPGFSLDRELGASDTTSPAELFIYDPSYLYLFAREDLLGERRTIRTELPP